MEKIYKSHWPDLPFIPNGNAVSFYFDSPYNKGRGDCVGTVDALTGKSYTVDELHYGSTRYATVLREKFGVRRGDVVCLFGFNNALLQPIHFSALILGAIVSPANITYTAEELAHQLRVAEPCLVYAAPEQLEVAKEAARLSGVKRCAVRNYNDVLDEVDNATRDSSIPETSPLVVDGLDTPAYYCFSSGTSGLPKGVVTTHSNIATNCLQASLSLSTPMHEGSAMGAFLPMSHIMGLQGYIWGGPYRGFKVVIAPRFDFVQMLEAVKKYGITHLSLVPPIAHLLAKHPVVEKYPEVRNIEYIRVGAAPTSKDVLALLKQRLGKDTKLTQGYGLTETSPVCVAVDLERLDVYGTDSSGSLLPSTEARLVDPQTGKDAAESALGELWIRGPQVMKGYLKNPAATAEALTPDKWLRTGDIARVDKHGQFFIVDRIKELIKSMGNQVAPAELEAILISNPDVLDAAVVGISDADKGTELPRAYLVLREGAEIDDILAWFNGKMSRSKKLWGGAVVLDTIPKNPSGKIIRRDLRDRAEANKDKVVGALGSSKAKL